MKILVLGWYYSSNMGDAVICDCVAELLRCHFPQAQITVRDMAGRTRFPQRKTVDRAHLDHLRRRQILRSTATHLGWDKQLSHEIWCFRESLPQMEAVTEGDWDLAVFAGGQLFMDSLALYVVHLTKVFEKRNIPVIFNACGIGPCVSPALRERLTNVLKSPTVRLVSCRDGAELVNSWCGEAVAVATDDAALWAGECYGMEKKPSHTVGLGVLYPQSLSPRKTAAFWRKIMQELDKKQIPWKMFTNGFEQDMVFARSLLDGRPEADFLCPAPESPEELVSLIASFRSLIGFRLHSHIIAASLGIPTVALVWDQKVYRFFEKMDLQDRCFTIHDSASSVISALVAAETASDHRRIVLSRRQASRNLLLNAADRI